MDQADVLSIFLGAGGGFLLGLLYFAGLWWTASRAGRVEQRGLLLLGSFGVRLALLLGGIFLLSGGRPLGIAAALVGVWVARRAMLSYVKGRETHDPPAA